VPSRSMMVIASTAESMMARILARFSASAACVCATAVTSRVMKTARCGGPSESRNARPRVSSVISCPSAWRARKADRHHFVDLEGLAQGRFDVGPVPVVDDVESGVSSSAGFGVAVDLLALGLDPTMFRSRSMMTIESAAASNIASAIAALSLSLVCISWRSVTSGRSHRSTRPCATSSTRSSYSCHRDSVDD